jgi:hypothetical protein
MTVPTIATPDRYVTVYERRVALVADTLRAHSDLDEAAATALAVHVLAALDHIPEVIR